MFTPKLNLYTIFHLNIAYSSIEEEQRADVINRCYWPLLNLARQYKLHFGIEATGYTLETINQIDPEWVRQLKLLIQDGRCELVGSGYAQIIGPLVPAEVNAANLRIGNEIYERLIGVKPVVTLINEQAYSAGLIQHYIDAGYGAIVMEWDNPYRVHPKWKPEWRYLPQIACGQYGEEIPLVWNHSIAFQKVQRYAHADMELEDYLAYLSMHVGETERAFSFYGNDVEVFDFRPNRYETEAALQHGEWKRIEILLKILLADERYQFILPSEVLQLAHVKGANNRLHLEAADQPIPVKKQGKYNVTRWAVTGRDDLGINTACWRIYEALKAKADTSAHDDDAWKELCYLWSSDFRTHITEKRWTGYGERLRAFEEKIGTNRAMSVLGGLEKTAGVDSDSVMPNHVHVSQNNAYVAVETEVIKIRLNRRRGLAIDRLWFKNICEEWLCGTLQHGYYDDINWGADYYTGHLVLESPGYRRITDLEPVKKLAINYDQTTESVRISTELPLMCGKLFKTVHIETHSEQPSVILDYRLEWSAPLLGSLRLGHVTINPDAFSGDHLFYATHNGGYALDSFQICESISDSIDHGDAISFLVSAKQALGCTGGFFMLGDQKHYLKVSIDKTASALVGMVQFHRVGQSYICRLTWSAREMDDTSKMSDKMAASMKCRFRICAAPIHKPPKK